MGKVVKTQGGTGIGDGQGGGRKENEKQYLGAKRKMTYARSIRQ